MLRKELYQTLVNVGETEALMDSLSDQKLVQEYLKRVRTMPYGRDYKLRMSIAWTRAKGWVFDDAATWTKSVLRMSKLTYQELAKCVPEDFCLTPSRRRMYRRDLAALVMKEKEAGPKTTPVPYTRRPDPVNTFRPAKVRSNTIIVIPVGTKVDLLTPKGKVIRGYETGKVIEFTDADVVTTTELVNKFGTKKCIKKDGFVIAI